MAPGIEHRGRHRTDACQQRVAHDGAALAKHLLAQPLHRVAAAHQGALLGRGCLVLGPGRGLQGFIV